MTGDFFDPNGPGASLQNFGFATMAASQQPGVTTLSALGQGGMGMNASALQRAQTQDIQSQSQSRNLQNQLLPYQLEFMKYRMKALQDLDNGQSDTPPPNSAGQTWSPTLGRSQSNASTARPVNNPGNLRPVGQATGFQQFNTPEDGMNALQADLTAKINGSPSMKGQQPTLRNIVYTYAPPNENNTAAYLENVSKTTGIAPNQVLTADDIGKLAPAITKQEGNGNQAPQRNIGQGIATSPSLPQNSANIQTLQGRVDAITKKLNRAELAQLPTKSLEENLKATQDQLAAAMKTQQEVESAGPKTGATKQAENTAGAAKTLAAINSSIDTQIQNLNTLKRLSKRMPDRGPADLELWGSKHLGNQDMSSAWADFNTMNKQMFVNGLMGSIPAGSRLDILIVKSLQAAKEIDPYTDEKSREAVINRHIETLKQAKANAEKNYGILSGNEPPSTGTAAPEQSAKSITHIYKPGQGIVPIGVQ